MTRYHCGCEGNFRNPTKSGSCSISEAITASSVKSWSLTVCVFPKKRQPVRLVDFCFRTIWRWPISLEANSAVPPRSLAEQRRIRVQPQFSTMLCDCASLVADISRDVSAKPTLIPETCVEASAGPSAEQAAIMECAG